MIEQLNSFFFTLSGMVWGVPVLALLVGTGIILTVRLRGIQLHKLFYALGMMFANHDDEPGDISHFQALMTALAATIGTGNIIGVATAIYWGGPGALFWMWLAAFFGMATKYGEGILAVKYRVQDEHGEMSGGPMYYLELGLKQKWLGVAFAAFACIAALGTGNMIQANAIAGNLKALGIEPIWSGMVCGVATAAVILGGVKRIGKITSYIVPAMAFVYVLGCLIILARFSSQIPQAFAMIFDGAFNGSAASGGFAGAAVMLAIRKGISRGVFSNEAGLGTAPIAAAAAKTKEPVEQALVSMTGTFIDTICVCTMTGLVLIVTGVWNSGAEVVTMAGNAFSIGLPGVWGGFIVSFGLIFFAYSTILGWGYYGEKCFEYLFGIKAVLPYRILWIILVPVGAVAKLDLLWNASDCFNGMMIIPNLIGLIGLSGVIVSETNKYLDKLKDKKEKVRVS
jgi:AGCS family alanine or glycine:cation symporter